jgi:hypothetical protein
VEPHHLVVGAAAWLGVAIHPGTLGASSEWFAVVLASQPEQHPANGGIRGGVRGVSGNQCPLAPFPVLLQVCVLALRGKLALVTGVDRLW